MPEITIGIDIGTTSVKALAVDAEGRVRSRSRIPHALIVPEPDMLEHDPLTAWCEGPRRALAALGPYVAQARGIGVCGMVPSITALDEELRPLSPGPLYGDRRALAADTPGIIPSPLDAREGDTLLRWAVREWPEAYAYWPAQTLAAVTLGGEPALDLFAAMAFFPAFDGTRWDGGLGTGVEHLPAVVPEPGAPAGRAPGGAVFAAPSADAPAEQIVTSVENVGEAFVIGGATLITWAVTEGYREVPGLWAFPHSRPGRYFLGGPSNAGGLFLDWARRLLADGGGAAEPERVPLWLPYVRGERTPLHDRSLRSSLHGLDLTHDAAALRRAAYEAAGFVVRRHLDLAKCTPERIVVSGGAVRDPEWIQALADCTGAVVEAAAVPEGAALGTAWLARMAAGLETSVDDARRWARVGVRVEPEPRWAKACAERYGRLRALAGIS